MSAQIIPIRDLETVTDRDELARLYQQTREAQNAYLRKQIIDNCRIDILATEILGIEVQPFHLRMMQWQFRHPDNLQLAFRGAGKTTTLTVTRAIWLLCKNRDLRILIASKTKGNAEDMLAEVKGHLENNERLIEIFGAFYDPRVTTKWTTEEVEVLGRTKVTKEPSIMCGGVDSAIVSKHFDVIFADDLVDEDNARTPKSRERTRVWYYQTLMPTLEPPDPEVPHRGEIHRLGTRYHHDDLYGHLRKKECKDTTQVISALDSEERSPWPEKYPPEHFQRVRENSGHIIFLAQYQCDTEAMRGEIFQFDDCPTVLDSEIPWDDLIYFTGVDLAIGEVREGESEPDGFSFVTIGVKGRNIRKDDVMIYVVDFDWGHFRFSKQTKLITAQYDRWKSNGTGIESNAYQASQAHNVKDTRPDIRVIPIQTVKDKTTRAWKLSPLFEQHRMIFRREHPKMNRLIAQLVGFPKKPVDGFDALDLANATRKRRRKRNTRREPGVI